MKRLKKCFEGVIVEQNYTSLLSRKNLCLARSSHGPFGSSNAFCIEHGPLMFQELAFRESSHRKLIG